MAAPALEYCAEALAASRPYLRYLLVPVGIYAVGRLLRTLVPGPQHRADLVLRDRVVLITGASSGLGRQLAVRFYREGAKLILAARSLDRLKELCAELKAMDDVRNPHEPVYEYLDMCDPNGFEGIIRLLPEGKLDVLVNNAGISMRGSCRDTPMKVCRQVMEVNYFGHVAVTKALLDVIAEDGAIVVTSSLQGRISVPYRSAYSASKHALQAYFDALRCEDRPDLHILVVSAGYMKTELAQRALNTRGEPTGQADPDIERGLSPERAAELICDALVHRRTELLMAPWVHRLAIFLRWFWPELYFWMVYRRGRSDAHRKIQ